MSYEGSDVEKSASLTAAMDAYTTLRGHIVVHTSTLPILIILLFVATGYQGLSVFEGDFWTPGHHYDFFSSEIHQLVVNVSDVLDYEHPYHEYRKDHPEVHQDHPHHHSNLEKIVSSHAQMDLLYISFHAYLLILLSVACRGYFFLKRQSYISTVIIMGIVLVSAIAQGISLVLNILISFMAPSIWIWIKIAITFLVLLIEISTLFDIHDIRKYVMFFSQIYYNHKYQEMLINPESQTQKESQEIREMITRPTALYNTIQTSIANLERKLFSKKKKKKKF